MVNNMFIWFQIVIATKMFSFKLVFVFNVCGQSLWSLWEAAHHVLLQLQLFQEQDQTSSSFHTTAEKTKANTDPIASAISANQEPLKSTE